jgi:hypothetical protein
VGAHSGATRESESLPRVSALYSAGCIWYEARIS